jgi:hypothetical protein
MRQELIPAKLLDASLRNGNRNPRFQQNAI